MAAVVSSARSAKEDAGVFRGGAPFAGKYAVVRLLGQGGMGTVFEARHLRLGHRVAIKVLGSELRDYPELVTRFEREARAAGALKSRHAVRVFDIDLTEDATPFIVMELLRGRDLGRILENDGPQRPRRVARWIIEACDAIAEAHRLGIVHRDLKPSNLFLTDDGAIKVLDFGVAKRLASKSKEVSITHAVAPLGTPQYMSPEQVRCAKDVDARTDVWSLGVTIYELVTGRTPFAHENPSACIASIAADPVPDPRTLRDDLPPGLAEVILRALRKDREERFASVAELVEALAPFAAADDDECLSSVVREVISASTAIHSEQCTLDDAPRSVDVSAAASGLLRRRWRSPLALGSAALLGVVALVVTPKCVGTKAAPSTSVQPASAESRSAEHAQAAAPVAAAVEPPATITTTTTAMIATTTETTAPAPAAPKKPRAVKPARERTRAVGDSPVHGGLSGPGF